MSALEQVRAALGSDPVDRGAIATILDGVDVHERVTIVRSLGGREQAALWDASDGQNVTLEELVPPAVGPSTEVIHAWKNSLPVFTKFEKGFCSTADDGASLYGYN